MKPKVQLPAFLRCDSDPVVSEISESGELTKALLQGKSNGTKDQDILDNFSTEALAGALSIPKLVSGCSARLTAPSSLTAPSPNPPFFSWYHLGRPTT